MTQIRKRKLGFLCHILRGNGVGRDSLQGIVEGRRARARRRTKFVDRINEFVGCETTVGELQLAEDRCAWRSFVVNINAGTTLR